jgi:hypothetical protein
MFFDRFVQAVTLGKSIDAVVERSSTMQVLGDEYLSQGRSVADDLTAVLGRPGVADDLKNLSLAGLLTRLANDANADDKPKLQGLLDAARKMGIK